MTTLAHILASAGIALAPQLDCMTEVIYHEARGESQEGMVAVGIVVSNRTLSDKFPDTPCEVMLEPHQFSFVSHGLHLEEPTDRVAWETALRASQEVLAMPARAHQRPLDRALYFHSGNKPLWDFNKLEEVVKIGNHTFYRDKENTI